MRHLICAGIDHHAPIVDVVRLRPRRRIGNGKAVCETIAVARARRAGERNLERAVGCPLHREGALPVDFEGNCILCRGEEREARLVGTDQLRAERQFPFESAAHIASSLRLSTGGLRMILLHGLRALSISTASGGRSTEIECCSP